jgi:hypothetical protein
LQPEPRRDRATSCGDCLTHQRTAVGPNKVPKPRKPQKAVCFTTDAAGAFALENRTRDSQPKVEIKCQHIDIGDHVPAGVAPNANGHSKTNKGSFGEFNSPNPSFKIRACIELLIVTS